jgi:secreted PhoX family phosphatase
MEWVAVDEQNNKLYISMSEINRGMSDGEGDIQLPENNCGIVYEADLDDSYNITNLKPLIVGGPYDENADENACALDNISNPDSLFVDPQGNVWIGEDTGEHVNNMIWKWDGSSLTRFATLPAGAEATGVMITDNNDMFFSVQHPSAMSLYPYNRSTVVAINGWKADEPFESVPVPEGDAMHTLVVAAGEPQILARVGELIPADPKGQRWGQVDNMDGSYALTCNQPDGNTFLAIDEQGTEGYLYTNYECRPGAVGKMYISHDGEQWQIAEGENVNFDGVNGTWNNCGTSLTPWNTTLTSEEYEPFATVDGWQQNVAEMNGYMGGQANPYDYGWLVELFPDPKGDLIETQIVKQYAMGRFSHEMAMVMPDGQTVYHGDDGTDTVLFKFVADEPGDLGAGTLYAAQVTQNADESLDLTWVELGSSNNDEIAEAIEAMTLE